jgi:hypothetical protein
MPIVSSSSIRLLVATGLLLAAAPTMQSASSSAAVRGSNLAARELMADFVANHGQWRGDVKFTARRGQVVLALEPHAIRISAIRPGAASVAFAFEGASPDVTLAGEQRQPTVYNFLSGRDRSAWQLNVPSYRSVLYRQMYDGIDIRVREQSQHFEYDVLISPQADVQQVAVRVDGARSIEMANDGALLVTTDAGVLRQTPPTTFEILPDGRQRSLNSAFRIISPNRYAFAVPDRDRSLPLVIDPGLIWSTLIGGTAHEEFSGLEPARDGSGDLFVSGGSFSTDFGHSPTPVYAVRAKAFVARLDAIGSHYDFVTFINGLQNQTYPGAIAADATGGVTLVGTTVDLDFPVTAGAYQTSFRSTIDGQARGDAFVLRLAADGTPVFGTYLGGSAGDGATAIVRDPSGAFVIIGTTRSPDFPTTPGAYDETFNAAPAGDRTALSEDTFIARLSADGSRLTYGTFFGGQTYEATRDAVIDAQGYLTIVGVTTSSETGRDIPVTADAFDATWNGWEDGFIARFKLDSAGAADLKYSSFLGGVNLDAIEGIALDPTNAETVVVAGHTWYDHFTGPFFPTTSGVLKPTLTPITPPTQLFPHSKTGFVTKFRFPTGGPGSLVWSTFAGGNWEDYLSDVAIDEVGNVIVAGGTRSYDLPTTRGAIDRTQDGVGNEPDDCFVWKLNATASQLVYSTYFGGTGADCVPVSTIGAKLAYLGNSTIALAGTAVPYDFPTTVGAVVEQTDPVSDPGNPFVATMTLEADNSGDLIVDAPTLVSPPNNSTTGGSGGAVVFRWNEVNDASGIEGYVYEIATRSDFAPAFTGYKGSVNGNEVILGTIAIRTPWYWRVRAADRAGNLSAWSATSTFTAGVDGGTPIVNAVQIYPTAVIGGNSAQGVLHMTGPAPAGGAVVTLTTRGPVSIPQSVTIPAGAITAAFTIDTTPVTRTTSVSIYATINGVGAKGTLSVDVASGPKATSLAIDPMVVTGGNPSTGTVTLSAPAPAGGTVVPLVSSHPHHASVPSSVTVPAGATTATFPIATSAVPFAFDVTIEAVSNVNASRKLALRTPGPRLTSFTLSASNVSGGAIVTGTVVFSGPIPPAPFPATGDALVTLKSTHPAVGLSSLVAVPIGQTSATFNLGVRNVPTTTTLEIIAAYDDVVLRAPLTVNGSSAALSSLTLNVNTLTGGQGGVGHVTLTAPAPAGHVLLTLSSSSPAITLPPDVTVSSGTTTGLFAFNALPVDDTTLATITASYGASTASANVTINPARTANLWVTGLTLNPSTVTGGGASTATVTLNAAAPTGGASVQLAAMSPATVPPTITVPAGTTSATFNVSTTTVTTTTQAKVWALLNTTWGAVLTVQGGGTTSTGTPAAPSLLAPSGGARVTLPLTLDWNDVTHAASYQVHVDDSSSFPSPRIIDTTVTASQLTTSSLSNRQYWWRVRGRNSNGVAGAWSSIRSFTVQAPAPTPAPTTPTLASLSVSPSSVVGGSANAQGTATLSAAAPSGGATVTLSSSNTSAATVPASITIPSGATTGTFTVSSRAVTVSTAVTLSGTFGGVTRSAAVTVTPASTGGGSAATLTVSATGRSGERVVSNPTGISVSVGSSGSASFAAGTSITLSVSNGRDAIWSGACSSGGNKTRTCTFTLNANASVNANVQ